MFSHARLQAHGDVKSSAGRHCTAHTRHRNDGYILDLNIGRRLGNEDQTLIQEVQETFVGLDRAFDAAVAVMAVPS